MKEQYTIEKIKWNILIYKETKTYIKKDKDLWLNLSKILVLIAIFI